MSVLWDATNSPFRSTVLENTTPLTCGDQPCIQANIALLRNGWHSDCVVKCQSYEWKTHRSILCTRNNYFRAALTGPVEEGASQKVTLDDDEPYAVECLLYYLYSFEYPEPTTVIKITDQPQSTWDFEVELFKIADKREAHHLRAQALADILRALASSGLERWQTHLDKFIASVPFLWDVPAEDGERIRKNALSFMITKKNVLFEMPQFKKLLEVQRHVAVDFFCVMARELSAQELKIKELRDSLNMQANQIMDQEEIINQHGKEIKEQKKTINAHAKTIEDLQQNSTSPPTETFKSGYVPFHLRG